MKRLKFKCTLLSELILNQRAATEGNNSTLDFIPGNVFLGIVAKHYAEFGQEAQTVFHSGGVRFGDAHPQCNSEVNVRTLHVPASFYYPKLKSMSEELYVHHAYSRLADEKENGVSQQLKQCRNGFYAFIGNEAHVANLEKSFAIKSAYDPEERRSRDSQMYGYESLDKGAVFLFDVEVDDDTLVSQITTCLVGRQYVGRSRTAQYGMVCIEETTYSEPLSSNNVFRQDGEDYATVYADGRLIFLDKNNELTYTPEAKDLGIDSGVIDWQKSQVRTFLYAPWNSKRATRDADRLGIEKGSVFVVRLTGPMPSKLETHYVGVYRNEGFGKVIYNPDFLDFAHNTNGLSLVRINEGTDKPEVPNSKPEPVCDTLLLRMLREKRNTHEDNLTIYNQVNDFVKNNRSKFKSESFASQWGTIRTIAMTSKGYDEIKEKLFDKEAGYLNHGVAEEKWKWRLEPLRKFMEQYKDSKGNLVCRALVNLSSEMAKASKKN